MSLRQKFEAGITDLTSETLEGAALIEAAASRARMIQPMRPGCASIAKKIRTAENSRRSMPSRIRANWKC